MKFFIQLFAFGVADLALRLFWERETSFATPIVFKNIFLSNDFFTKMIHFLNFE